ncbi:MAG: Uma2 family endonuclease [Symploca sp. SIO2B6]|nr:Uma2 family endonuclease [Symploca sp. SIO2B6]
MLLELERLTVPPGQRVLLQDVSWQEFESILEELGEHRAQRLAYDSGVLEIMTPLPGHEASKEIIGDLVKALLEELDIDFWTLGSTTFKNIEMLKGVEPDQCFYIKNEAAVRGKESLDLAVDPPPDLVLEIDLTSRTHPHIYQALRVPELWRFERGLLKINVLQGSQYIESQTSLNFPQLSLIETIPHYLKQSKIVGRNSTMRTFRSWIRENTSNHQRRVR